MNGRAYYNEFDPYAAAWLRNLIAAGHIADGDVDERSIEDVCPADLRGYTQCHFFAGIGVWSYALRVAGWDDSRSVWTGSCPCQPFSAAGKGGGFADERHLWPHWFHLIGQCRPGVVFGEQVASSDGLGWLDLVQADLEGANYASAAIDLCAAGVGAPHIRQRLFFVADSVAERYALRHRGESASVRRSGPWAKAVRQGVFDKLADANGERLAGRSQSHKRTQQSEQQASRRGNAGRRGELVDTDGQRQKAQREIPDRSSAVTSRGFWSAADWLYCRDGKYRPVEPGTFPLAHGIANRVGRLRAYGNAINAEAAAAFIRAYLECGLNELENVA